MKNKGFTLIELLAVIVILAIILLIAVPQVLDVIEDVKLSSFELDSKMLLKEVDILLVDDSSFDVTTIDEENMEDYFNVSKDNYLDLNISMESDDPYIVAIGKNSWDGYVAYGTYGEMNSSKMPEGLAAYWQLDGNAVDSTGNGNDGTVYGATLTTGVKGIENTAYHFDGIDDYIGLVDTIGSTIDIRSDLTITSWVKYDDMLGLSYIVSKNLNSGYADQQYSLSFYEIQGNSFHFDVGGVDDFYIGTGEAGNWIFLSMTFDGSKINAYMDGVLLGSHIYDGDLVFKPNFSFGRRVEDYYLNGSIDNVRIYNRALTAEELTLIYNIEK